MWGWIHFKSLAIVSIGCDLGFVKYGFDYMNWQMHSQDVCEILFEFISVLVIILVCIDNVTSSVCIYRLSMVVGIYIDLVFVVGYGIKHK